MNLTLEEARIFAQDHTCAECGGGLLMPWVMESGKRVHTPQCRSNVTHTSFTAKNRGVRQMYNSKTKKHDLEVDIMTQQETGALAIRELPTDIEGMIKRGALAKWPQDLNPAAKEALAQVALAYQLDYLNGELIPYQGQPYITIKGRRRLDEVAGNRFKSISYRPLTPAEREWYLEADAIQEGDLNGFAVGTMSDGTVWEAFAKVTKEQRGATTDRGGKKSPVVAANPVEMFEHRAERHLRERVFGPVARPQAIMDVVVLQEGEEVNTVTGEVISVSDAAVPPVVEPTPEEAFEALGGGGAPVPDDYQPELPR